jgi:hypothetical protein
VFGQGEAYSDKSQISRALALIRFAWLLVKTPSWCGMAGLLPQVEHVEHTGVSMEDKRCHRCPIPSRGLVLAADRGWWRLRAENWCWDSMIKWINLPRAQAGNAGCCDRRWSHCRSRISGWERDGPRMAPNQVASLTTLTVWCT